MEIRLLDKNDIPEAKALWKQAFGDSDAFIDTYFRNKILPRHSLGCFNGSLVSVIHMLPYLIRVQGRALQSAYIAGAATDEAHRGNGLMRTMLLESLKLMRMGGIVMTHLYPFKHSFYENFGWATYSYVDKRVAKGKGNADADVKQTENISVLHALYHNMTRNMDGYVIRTEREWRWRIKELKSDGGSIYMLMRGGMPAAYMMAYVEGGKAQAIETVYTDEADAHTLAQWLLSRGCSEARYNLVTQRADAAPHGMARVVDAQRLLDGFGLNGLTHTVRITDAFAQWNNIGCDHAAYEMDVAALAQLVHRGASLRGLDENTGEVEYDNNSEVFVPRNTCIFEEY